LAIRQNALFKKHNKNSKYKHQHHSIVLTVVHDDLFSSAYQINAAPLENA